MLLQGAAATGGASSGITNEFHTIDVICHIGSLCQFIAFMQHDMLTLRVLEMSSALLHGIYALLHTHNTMDCHFLWAILHFSVNAYHVVVYLHRRFATKLSDEDCALHAGPLRGFSTAEFAELKRRYRWETHLQGEDLLLPGRKVSSLLLLTTGSADVLGEHGEHIKTLDVAVEGPQFIGEMAFFTRETPLFTMRVASPHARCVAWDMHQVRELTHSHGHSLEASAFRQLPSLFARQLVTRVQKVQLKVVGLQDAALEIDDATVHHSAGRRQLLPAIFKMRTRSTVDVMPGQPLANTSPDDWQSWRAKAKWDTRGPSPAPATPTPTGGELRSLAWAENAPPPASCSASATSEMRPFSPAGSGQNGADVIGSQSKLLS